MNPAKLKHRITIYEEVEIEDEDGFKITNPVDVCKVWAMFKTLRGSEYYTADAPQHELVSRIVIRYRKGIDARMKINYKGRIFDIIEPPINDDEQNKTLTILVKECV